MVEQDFRSVLVERVVVLGFGTTGTRVQEHFGRMSGCTRLQDHLYKISGTLKLKERLYTISGPPVKYFRYTSVN